MSSSEIYIFTGTAFLVGMLLGYLFSLFTNRNKDRSRMEDELTRAKRELSKQKAMLEDFFNSSNDLFEQLEKSYQAYSEHMNEHALKMVPWLGNMYVIKKQSASRKNEQCSEDTTVEAHTKEIDDMYANKDEIQDNEK